MEAMQLPVEERAAFLDRPCADDEELRWRLGGKTMATAKFALTAFLVNVRVAQIFKPLLAILGENLALNSRGRITEKHEPAIN